MAGRSGSTAVTSAPGRVGERKAVKVRAAVDVVRNAVALMVSTVASAAFGMLFWVVSARLFDVADLGRASATVSAITLLGGLAQLSLNSAFIRFLPTAGEATGRFLLWSYLASGSAGVLLAVGFYLLGMGRNFLPPGPLALAGFCLAVVSLSFSTLQDSVLTALRRTTWVPIENIAIALGRLGLLPVLVSGVIAVPLLISWSVPMTAAVVVLSVTIFARLAPAQARRMRGHRNLPARRELLSFMGAQNLNGLVSNLNLYLPPLLVTMVLGTQATGLFYVPWLIGTALFALSWNVLASLVVEAATDPSQIKAQVRHAFRLLLLVCVGGGVIVVAGAPLILAVLGPKYAGGEAALRLIGLGLPFSVVGTLFSVTAFMAKKIWPLFFYQLAAAAIFLGGSYFALHRFGVAGAAGAFLTSEIVMSAAVLPVTIRRLRKLVEGGTAPATPAERVPARGVAPVSARGVAVVPRVAPGYLTGPMQVVFLPATVIDWERLRQVETVFMNRLDLDDPVDSSATETVVMNRIMDTGATDATVIMKYNIGAPAGAELDDGYEPIVLTEPDSNPDSDSGADSGIRRWQVGEAWLSRGTSNDDTVVQPAAVESEPSGRHRQPS